MSDSASGPPLGTVLDGKYRITKQVGRGGMATIFSAENVDIGKPVAVKVLARDLADSRTVTERFLREARAAAKIKSPYICEVYDVGTFDGRPFIVMELLQGESLYDRLARQRRLPPEEAIQITTQVCRGLNKAHAQQIVHRDLKPENIFLTTTEDGQPLSKLVDFGLAKFYEPHQDPNNARLTKEGALFGTPAYMSPEQAKAKYNVDHRSDLWALGCIVYEMVTGRTVWDVDQGVAMILAQVANGDLPDPRKYRSNLPEEFSRWFEKALARNVDERFQTAQEFSATLSQALATEPTSAVESSLGERGAAEPDTERNLPEAPTNVSSGPPPASGLASPGPGKASAPPTRKRYLVWGVAAAALLGGGAWLVSRNIASSLPPPVEGTPYAASVAEAQALLHGGNREHALETLQRVFKEHKAKAVRSLVSHLAAAGEVQGGPCKLEAVGHPRPFDATKESSKPSIIAAGEGAVVTWATSDSRGRITAFTALFDESLRRVSEPSDVTPAAAFAREPELLRVGDYIGLVYWDFAGDEAGVYTMLLDARGRGAGGAKLISSQEDGHPYYPHLTPTGDGSFVAVYVEPSRDRVHDLVARRLDARLEPASEPVALTAYATPRKGKIQAARPSVASLDGMLNIAYTVRRPTRQELLLLRVPLQAIQSGKGVEPADPGAAPVGSNEEMDRFLGQVTELSVGEGQSDMATIKCNATGCYVAWDKALSTAELAFLGKDGNVVWRRQLTDPSTSQTAARPGIALRGEGVVAAWYQDDRVLVTPVARGSPIVPGAAGRVKAILQQPQPLLSPAGTDGDYFVAWRGYEAAVPEPFVARMSCP